MNRLALVTGGNRGIGLEIARQLAKVGNVVILGARNMKLGEGAAKTISSPTTEVLPAELDVTKEATIKKLVEKIDSDFGRLDILVNNAGILIDESDLPGETKLEVIRNTLETNLIGPWRLCQAFLPLMKRNKYGRIVNVSSGAGPYPKCRKASTLQRTAFQRQP